MQNDWRANNEFAFPLVWSQLILHFSERSAAGTRWADEYQGIPLAPQRTFHPDLFGIAASSDLYWKGLSLSDKHHQLMIASF